jgi:hypothetical protein
VDSPILISDLAVSIHLDCPLSREQELLVPVWMYELVLGIAHLEFGGLNSAVWVVMEFKFENWLKFRAKSTMCYFGLAHFRAAPLRIGWNCKNLKKSKNQKL